MTTTTTSTTGWLVFVLAQRKRERAHLDPGLYYSKFVHIGLQCMNFSLIYCFNSTVHALNNNACNFTCVCIYIPAKCNNVKAIIQLLCINLDHMELIEEMRKGYSYISQCQCIFIYLFIYIFLCSPLPPCLPVDTPGRSILSHSPTSFCLLPGRPEEHTTPRFRRINPTSNQQRQ